MIRIGAILLATTGFGSAERYHLRLDSTLELNEWFSGYEYMVRKTDIHQRLRLFIQNDYAQPTPYFVNLDMSLGSDIGPDASVLEQWGTGRRTRVHLYRATLILPSTVPRTMMSVGRILFWDLHGVGHIDGIDVSFAPTTHLHTRLRLGYAPRVDWFSHGMRGTTLIVEPSEYKGLIIAPELRLMPHESFLINMAFRQAAGDELHRRELGSGLRWLFKDTHSLGVRFAYDLLSENTSDLEFDLNLKHQATAINASLGYRRPRFAAGSIWWAFAPEANHFGRLAINTRRRRWSGTLSTDFILFQPDLSQQGPFEIGTIRKEDAAIRTRFFMDYAFSDDAATTTAGVSMGHHTGYAGELLDSALRIVIPIYIEASIATLKLSSASGVTHMQRHEATGWNGIASWNRTGLEWRPDEGILSEVYLDTQTQSPRHVRLWVTTRMENLW